MDVVAASRISRGLVERGFGVLRFDFTGLGSSAGEFANTTFSSNVEDLVRAATMLRERHAAPMLLVGHSLGGAAVLAAAGAIPEVTAVATIGAPFDPGHITHLFPPETLAELDSCGQAGVRLAGRTFRVRRELIEDANAHNLGRALQGLDRALLVFHAARDEIVGIDNARRIFDAARHPKSFVSLDEADHFLGRPEDADYVAAVLAAWASRYLPPATTTPTLGAGSTEEGPSWWPSPASAGSPRQSRPGGTASSPTSLSASATTPARRPTTSCWHPSAPGRCASPYLPCRTWI